MTNKSLGKYFLTILIDLGHDLEVDFRKLLMLGNEQQQKNVLG